MVSSSSSPPPPTWSFSVCVLITKRYLLMQMSIILNAFQWNGPALTGELTIRPVSGQSLHVK